MTVWKNPLGGVPQVWFSSLLVLCAHAAGQFEVAVCLISCPCPCAQVSLSFAALFFKHEFWGDFGRAGTQTIHVVLLAIRLFLRRVYSGPRVGEAHLRELCILVCIYMFKCLDFRFFRIYDFLKFLLRLGGETQRSQVIPRDPWAA